MINSWEEGPAEGRERLKRWLEKALVASSIGEVIDDPS